MYGWVVLLLLLLQVKRLFAFVYWIGMGLLVFIIDVNVYTFSVFRLSCV